MRVQGACLVTGSRQIHLCELHQASPGCCCTKATLEQHHGYVMAMSRLHCGYVIAAAMAARPLEEAVLWLPGQPGEDKRVCSSCGSSFPPAS